MKIQVTLENLDVSESIINRTITIDDDQLENLRDVIAGALVLLEVKK